VITICFCSLRKTSFILYLISCCVVNSEMPTYLCRNVCMFVMCVCLWCSVCVCVHTCTKVLYKSAPQPSPRDILTVTSRNMTTTKPYICVLFLEFSVAAYILHNDDVVFQNSLHAEISLYRFFAILWGCLQASAAIPGLRRYNCCETHASHNTHYKGWYNQSP